MTPGLRLLTIDPGLRGCGVATFVDGRVERAWYSRNLELNERGPKAWREMAYAVHKDLKDRGLLDVHACAIEYPQIYKQAHQLGDQDDIIQVACTAGAVATLVAAHKWIGFLPRQWKGQVPKAVHNMRVLCSLDEEEKKHMEPIGAGLRHNVIDAIGIGLHVLRIQGARTGKPHGDHTP